MKTIEEFLSAINSPDSTLGSDDPIPTDPIEGMRVGENPLHVICRKALDALYGLSGRPNFLGLFQQNSSGPNTSPFHVLKDRAENGEEQSKAILEFLQDFLGNIEPQQTFSPDADPTSLGLIPLEQGQPAAQPLSKPPPQLSHPSVCAKPSPSLSPRYGYIINNPSLRYDITTKLEKCLENSPNSGIQLMLGDIMNGDLKIIGSDGTGGIKSFGSSTYEFKPCHAGTGDVRVIGREEKGRIIFYYLTDHAGLKRPIPPLPTPCMLFGGSKVDLGLPDVPDTGSSSSASLHAPGKSPPRRDGHKPPTKKPPNTGGPHEDSVDSVCLESLQHFKDVIRTTKLEVLKSLVGVYSKVVLNGGQCEHVIYNSIDVEPRAQLVFNKYLDSLKIWEEIPENLTKAYLKLHKERGIPLHFRIQEEQTFSLPSLTAAPPQTLFTSLSSSSSTASPSLPAAKNPPKNGAVMSGQRIKHPPQKKAFFSPGLLVEVAGTVILYTKDDICSVLERTSLKGNKYIEIPCSHSFPTEWTWGVLYYFIHFGALFFKTNSFTASTIFASIKTSSYVLPRITADTQAQASNCAVSAAFGFATGIFTQLASNFLLINVMPQISMTMGLSVVVEYVTLTTGLWRTGIMTAATFVAHDLLNVPRFAFGHYNLLILVIPPILAGFAALYFGFGILGALHMVHFTRVAIEVLYMSGDARNSETFLKLIVSGNLDAVKTFVTKYPEVVNKRDEDSITPLFYAIENHQMVKLLLEAGADPNVGTAEHKKIIHLAAHRGLIPAIKLLLQYKADINAIIPSNNTTAIDVALGSAQLGVAIFLIAMGAHFNISRVLSLSPQERRVEYPLFPEFVAELQVYVKDTTAGESVIFLINVCNALYTLQQNNNVKLQDHSWKENCNASIALTRGPGDTNAKLCTAIRFFPKPGFCGKATSPKNPTTSGESDGGGETKEFFKLIALGDLDEVQAFAVKHPGVVHKKDEHTVTPLEYAVIRNQMAIFLWLLDDEKVSVHEVNAQGRTTLSIASQFPHSEQYITRLLEAGADPNAGNNPPVHMAAHRGLILVIKQLLLYGADINAIASSQFYNATATDMALVGNHLDAAIFLVTQGAHLNISYVLSFSPQKTSLECSVCLDFIAQLQSYVKHVPAGAGIREVINICNALYTLEQKGVDLDDGWRTDCAAGTAYACGSDDNNDELCAAIQFFTEFDFYGIAGKIADMEE